MDVKGFTIDSETTRDIDDAIWVEGGARGWTVTVCISNVALAIAKGSSFDKTAKRRVETLYHRGNRNSPMIPRRFSEGTLSLFEGKKRHVVAIRMLLDHMLEPRGLPIISPAKLISKKRFAYSEIPSVIQDESHPLHTEVSAAARLAMSLVEKRRKGGAFVLYDLTHGWIMTESGHVRQLKDVRETMGNIIVQEMMILANTEVAKFCVEKDIPIPFRNHTARASAPPRERMMDLLEAGVASGVPQDFTRARDSFLLVMNRARYGASLEGHYGLNLSAYLHGTSPIRRYADLIAQRQILGYLDGCNLPYDRGEVEEVCEHINGIIESNAEKRSWDEIDRANRNAEKSISKGNLTRLSNRDFERVVKVSTRGEFDTSVANEFLRRMNSDKAAVIDIFQILLKSNEDWDEVRNDILGYIVKNPHLAPSIATVASQIEGWSDPRYLSNRGGEDNSVIHAAAVEIDEPGIRSREVRASSIKLARQRAVVEALHIHLGKPLPEWPLLTGTTSPSSKPRTLDRNAANPIGELGEYCQIRGIDLPEYSTERAGGSDHQPEFTVSCKAAGVHVKSSPMPSKKSAKKEAARRAIQLIIERS